MREDRDWSQTQGFEYLREGLNFGPKSRAAYVAIDNGQRQPTTDEQKFLVGYFGKTPDDIPEPPPPTDELALALLALTAELAAMREERAAWARGVAAILRAYEDGRVPVELLDALAPQLLESSQP